jgi:hypothetical protein
MKLRLIASALFGLLIFSILPGTIAAVNDDFGYLRSVVETLQHHRPWTDDWLEPWAASLSVASSVLFLATGSFYLATYGLLSFLAAVSFYVLSTLLARNGYTDLRSCLLAGLVLTCATVLWKSLEYTSVALYLPCFLLAIWAAEKRAWGAFLLLWVVGIGARQSAVAWVVFPGLEILRSCRRGRANLSSLVRLGGVVLGGMAFFLFLKRYMNHTHAQAMLTDHLLDRVDPVPMAWVAIRGSLLFLVAAGIAAFARFGLPEAKPAGGQPRTWLKVMVIGLSAWLILSDVRRWGGVEHLCYDDARGWFYLHLVVVLAALGWWFIRFQVRWTYVIYALASLVLLCLRSYLWDYYLIDIGLLGILSVVTPNRPNGAVLASQVATTPPLLRVGWALLALLHLTFVGQLKFDLDRGATVGALAERALRAKQLPPEDISFAPFGYLGGKWNPYFIAHEGRNDPAIAGFDRYLRKGAVDVGQGFSLPLHLLPRFRQVPPADRRSLILWDTFRFAWIFRAQYYLLRAPASQITAPEAAYRRSQYQSPFFPLNDAEWRQFIRTPAAAAPTPEPSLHPHA